MLQFTLKTEMKNSLQDLLEDQVPPLEGGRRFDSPEKIRQLIVQGSVWQANRRLKDPDSIPLSQNGPVTVLLPQKSIRPFKLDPSLVKYEDQDVLAVWKPENINTCPSMFSDIDCLSWGIQAYLAAQGSAHQVNTIHRLDRAARGLILFGKNHAAETWLYSIFAQRKIHKFYLAACPDFSGRRNHYRIEGDQEHRGKIRFARTRIHYRGIPSEIASPSGSAALFLACPETGRPHQIRKHFVQSLRPLLGDAAYGGYSEDSRLELACVAYRYLHPDGTWKYLRCPDPWLEKYSATKNNFDSDTFQAPDGSTMQGDAGEVHEH